MPALPRGPEVLRAWVERVLLGCWFHGGFQQLTRAWGQRLNRQDLRLCPAGLLAIARADDFHARPEFGAWAKCFFDRASTRAGPTRRAAGRRARLAEHASMRGRPSGDASKILFGARMAANAARAIDLGPASSRTAAAAGLRLSPTRAPGRLDAGLRDGGAGHQPRRRRLQRHRARPSLRRRRPAGGDDRRRPPAAFGVVVRDVANRTLLASQTSRLQPSLADPPLHSRARRAAPGTWSRILATRARRSAPRRPRRRGDGDVRVLTVHRFRAST
jgi:hypothetical protein